MERWKSAHSRRCDLAGDRHRGAAPRRDRSRVGEAIYAPTADALPLAIAPAGLAGRYSAVHQLAWGISSTLAPVLTASLLVVGNQTVWLVLTATATLLAIAYLGL